MNRLLIDPSATAAKLVADYAKTDPIAADEAEHGVCAQCGTCGGVGTYDERLGGEFFSNPQAPCPDCDGLGVYAKPMTPDEEAEQVNLRG